MKIESELPGVKKNVFLKKYTTFQIGGPAKYFYIAKSKAELIKAAKQAKKINLPFFVLGGGSNLLINDKGFSGLVIKNEARGFKVKKEKIIAESGAVLDRVIKAAVRAGLSGLEELSGIPGTLGGAVYGNAGWPRRERTIGNFVETAELLMPNGRIKKVKKNWLSFGYRNSRLKEIKNKNKKPVILEAVLKLKKDKKEDLKKRCQENFKVRSKKIPPGFSAGSIFKNFSPHPKKVFDAKPALKAILENFKRKDLIPAAYLIQECELKGKKIGQAQISEKHANFIVNLGKAKAKDVKKLIKLAKRKVKNKFGILLEEEICYLGFKN